MRDSAYHVIYSANIIILYGDIYIVMIMSLVDHILSTGPGEKLFLLGNEAIARGLLESGVNVATTYPGTPSSEVGDVLSNIAQKAGMYFEFSTNEKVALEIAFAASISGLRSFVFMKHVGLNVAADSFVSTVYSGVRGGMVVMTADDPSMFSSQNEQDNREYSALAHVPMFEPSNPQEAKDFLVKAYELSELFHIPVLFRTTTRVNHQRGDVVTAEIKPSKKKGVFTSNPSFYVDLPSNSYTLKQKLIEKMGDIQKYIEDLGINKIISNGSEEYGIITSGEGFNTVMDAVLDHNLKSDILKPGVTNPLPVKTIETFLRGHSKIIIAEELDDFLEQRIRSIAQLLSINVKIYGKMDGYFPYSHEFSVDTVSSSLSKIMGFDFVLPGDPVDMSSIPQRPPVFCPGCPHRATFYAVKRAVNMAKIKDVIYPSDIGCYSLGCYPPFNTGDSMISMGASIGLATGFAKVTGQHVVAFIGDSTFFHAGIPAFINAVRNNSTMTVVILDNRTTAMTGQQTNPGVPVNAFGENAYEESIEAILRSTGISNIKTVDPYSIKETLIAVSSAIRSEGISIVIARRECAILRDNEMRKEKRWEMYDVNQDRCTQCLRCVENFACPAIYIDHEKVKINPTICDGCGVCAEPYVCPYRAIEKVVPVAD